VKYKHVYKIRRKDGLYSMGGVDPRFNEKGKTWTTLAHVSLALSNYFDYHKEIPDWEVVELETSEVRTFSVAELRAATVQRAKERREAQNRKYHEEVKARELAELERLQKKYGSP
jgi:hypothetical protein